MPPRGLTGIVMVLLPIGMGAVGVHGERPESMILPLKHEPALSPELNLLVSLREAAGSGRFGGKGRLPILVATSDAAACRARLRYARVLRGGFLVAYATPAEVRTIARSRDVRYVACAGSHQADAQGIERRLFPEKGLEAPKPVFEGWPVVGIVDRNMKLLTSIDPDFASRVIASWDQGGALDAPQSTAACLSQPAARPQTVHGSRVAAIIHKLTRCATYVTAETGWDKADLVVNVAAISELAKSMTRPAIVCLCSNFAAGPHDGTSLFEAVLSAYANDGLIIVCSAGNGAGAAAHAECDRTHVRDGCLELVVRERPASDRPVRETTVDVWFDRHVVCDVSLRSSEGVLIGPVPSGQGRVRVDGRSVIGLCNGLSDAPNRHTNVLVAIKTMRERATRPREWTVRFCFADAEPFVCDAWLGAVPEGGASFANHVSCRKSLSEPATARGVIAVGAMPSMDARRHLLSPGPSRDGRLKPDIVAITRTATSYAAAAATAEIVNHLVRCGAGRGSSMGCERLAAEVARHSDGIVCPRDLNW